VTTRYIVQRATTREVLTYDAPLVTHDDLTRNLSKSGSVDLQISPDVGVLQKAKDGRLLWEKWGTLVTIETDSEIRFRGIVDRVTWDVRAGAWNIEVVSIAGYAYGMPFQGTPYYGAEVDPADVYRMIWSHLQSFPDSDLAVRVVGKTSVRVGSFSTANKTDTLNAYNVATKDYNAENAELKRLRAIVAASRKEFTRLNGIKTERSKALTAAKAKRPKDPTAIDAAQVALNAATNATTTQNAVIDTQQRAVDAQATVVRKAKAVKDTAYAAKVKASKTAKDDGGAWTLLWWEAPDCGRSIDDLAATAPFDWFERHYWSGDEPRTEIVIAYPRAGRRLSGPTDPTFEQGVNIVVPLEVEDDGDDYANGIYGVGAGEGAGSLRRSTAKRDGRLRRVRTFTNKGVKRAATTRTAAPAPTASGTRSTSAAPSRTSDSSRSGTASSGSPRSKTAPPS
jgi:hypothetical protein